MRPNEPNRSSNPGGSTGSRESYEILRLPVVLRARGRSRTMHFYDIRAGLFTKPVKIGPRAVGWPSSEVDAINEARVAGKKDDEIRTLVADLMAARTSAKVV